MQLQANVAKPRRDVGELLKLCAILGTSQLWNTHERNRETTWLVILCVACIAMAALLASMIANSPLPLVVLGPGDSYRASPTSVGSQKISRSRTCMEKAFSFISTGQLGKCRVDRPMSLLIDSRRSE